MYSLIIKTRYVSKDGMKKCEDCFYEKTIWFKKITSTNYYKLQLLKKYYQNSYLGIIQNSQINSQL